MTHPQNEPVSIVSGGAGFIGVTLVRRLLQSGRQVVVMDNFSNGSPRYLADLANDDRLHVIEVELANRNSCQHGFDVAASRGQVDEVWHLAANSDIPAGVSDADVDLKDTFLTTAEILRAMRDRKMGALYFASSSAIYGDLGNQALHESIGPLLPISNYGAMKLASEALISAAVESHLSRACLFRFPNVVGVPATHGVILDFIRKLKATPDSLAVLGDGSQRKSYLHVSDLVQAMLKVRSLPELGKIVPINVGPVDEGVFVRWIAEQVVARVRPHAQIKFGSGNKGWVGDVPQFRYSTDRLQSAGWSPSMGSAQAVMRAIDEIATQEGF